MLVVFKAFGLLSFEILDVFQCSVRFGFIVNRCCRGLLRCTAGSVTGRDRGLCRGWCSAFVCQEIIEGLSRTRCAVHSVEEKFVVFLPKCRMSVAVGENGLFCVKTGYSDTHGFVESNDRWCRCVALTTVGVGVLTQNITFLKIATVAFKAETIKYECTKGIISTTKDHWVVGFVDVAPLDREL